MRSRIEMTVGCRDSDVVPKVANAGEILVENGRQVQVMHNGVRVLAGGYYGDWMAEIITRLRGHHEPQEELVFHEVLKHVPTEAVMIDLGGFWSYYSLWFLSQAPIARRSIVVEPDPYNLSVGRANAEINGHEIQFIQACAGSQSTEARPFMTETAGEIYIPAVSVPDLLAFYGIDKLDILHCDTQGAETSVIRSCEDLLRRGLIRFIVVSTHAHQISGDPLTHQRCLAMLKEFGGRILAEHDVHESFSGDGLIAAYFGREPIDWPDLALSYNRYSTSLFLNPLYDLDAAYKEIADLRQIASKTMSEHDILARRLAAALEEVARVAGERDAAHAERDLPEAEARAVRSSSSWRISAPLRALGRLVKFRT